MLVFAQIVLCQCLSIKYIFIQTILAKLCNVMVKLYVFMETLHSILYSWKNFEGSNFREFQGFCLTSKILSSNFCQKSRTDIASLLSQFRVSPCMYSTNHPQLKRSTRVTRVSHAWRRWCCGYKRVCILKNTRVYTHT